MPGQESHFTDYTDIEEYIEEDNILNESHINIVYQNYSPKIYQQRNLDSFISHLSIIDVIANIGIENTKKYIENKQFENRK